MTRAAAALAAALGADALAVLGFSAAGRRSHAEGDGLAGLAHTAWPFLAALALAWVVAVAVGGARRHPSAVAPTGTLVWLGTVVGGHGLRLVSGQGSAWSFLVVTAVVLGVLLLGWRALVGRAGRAGGRARGTAPSRR